MSYTREIDRNIWLLAGVSDQTHAEYFNVLLVDNYGHCCLPSHCVPNISPSQSVNHILLNMRRWPDTNTKYNTSMVLVTGLPAKCALYHTSGEKKSGVWQWTATGQPFNYTGWAPREPNDNGSFSFIWNFPPGRKTWDDHLDTKACFICEYHIWGSYASWQLRGVPVVVLNNHQHQSE